MIFTAKIYVDEKQIREIACDDESSIEALTEQELGWSSQSGISVQITGVVEED